MEGIPDYFTSLNDLIAYFEQPHDIPYNVSTLRPRPGNPNGPQLLVCHDYKGGYNDSPISMGYTFNFWAYTDIFVYFSHYRVAPPPASWVRAAHRENVPILGTIIFEHKEAVPDMMLLTTPPPGVDFALLLARLARERGFDGWLLNVEVPLPGREVQASALTQWIGTLRTALLEHVGPHARVIWYDAVTSMGSLAWQDRLNAANAPFLRSAGSLFTNYTWASHYPQLSAQFLRDAPLNTYALGEGKPDDALLPPLTEIYTGIDVWGRGSHGGGGFNVHAALDHIHSAGTSTALFAPAWTWEHQEGRSWEAWWDDERRFWVGSGPHTAEYVRQTSSDEILLPGSYPAYCSHNVFRPIASFHPARPVLTPFLTTFNVGVGRMRFVNGAMEKEDSDGWTDVGAQTFVPGDVGEICFEDAWRGGASLRLSSSELSAFVRIRDVATASGSGLLSAGVIYKSTSVRAVPSTGTSLAEDVVAGELKHGWVYCKGVLRSDKDTVAFGVSLQGPGSILLGAVGIWDQGKHDVDWIELLQ